MTQSRKPSTKPRQSTVKKKPSPQVTRKTVVRPVKPKNPDTLSGKILTIRKKLAGTHVYVLTVPYEAQYLAKTLGAEYSPDLKTYLYEGQHLPQNLEPYRSEDYSWERWLEEEINQTFTPVQDVKAVMKPRPHQVDAIKKIEQSAKLGWRGFILADAVGIGKTLEAVFGAYVVAKNKGFTPANKAKTLIVAPKSVLPHWRNTLKAAGVNNLRIVVINYDQAKKLLDPPNSVANVKKNITANRHTMLHGRPNINWDIIIADESHKLKNDSQRTTAFTSIAQYGATHQAPFVIWCSATVAQAPLELGYLSPLIGQLTGTPNLTTVNWGDWLINNHFHVKKSKNGNYSWINPTRTSSPGERKFILGEQKKDVQRLSETIFNPKAPSIRRIPEEIAGWPTQNYIATPLQLTPETQRLYKEAWNEFRKYIGLHPRGNNPKSGLAATLRFRQKASLLSATATAEYVNDLLDNGVQVALSVEFMETLDAIKTYLEKKGWHCAEFTGRNLNERENERLKFQTGEAEVILFSVVEGINLHANELLPDGTKATSNKRAMVVHDIRYSAIEMTQIIGRTTRDGQLALAYLMYTENTVEAQILKVVLERMKNVKLLSGDEENTLEAIEKILDGV